MNLNGFKDNTESVDTPYGAIAYFRNDLYLGASLREYGEWARKELAFIECLDVAGQIVVDGGAFIGTHTLAFSRFVGESGLVYSFEAQPIYYRLLCHNIETNRLKNVEAFNVALSDQPGEAFLESPDISQIDSFGSFHVYGKNESGDKRQVQARTIDDLSLGACRLIKLDIEGEESTALRGARETIRRCQPIIYSECNSAEDGWPVVELMRGFEYRIYAYSQLAYNPTNYNSNAANIFGLSREIALVCVPKAHHDILTNPIFEKFEVVPINTLDDLVFVLVKKPQYKQEVLSTTSGAALWGNEFWRNEGELQIIEGVIAERQRMEERLQQKLESAAAENATLELQLARLQEAITERDSAEPRLKQELLVLAERSNQQAYSLEQATRSRDALNAQLQAIIDSTSWSLTRPLRELRRWISAPRQQVSRYVDYLGGRKQRELPTISPTGSDEGSLPESSYPIDSSSSTFSRLASDLQEADGVWEWADYALVKDRIAATKQSRRVQNNATPPKLCCVEQQPYTDFASQIRLPAVPARPDVSIIIPVFNNLRYTLECLHSISDYSGNELSYEVIVADDASTDETSDILKQIPNLRLIENPKNKGFLGNCNDASAAAAGEYLLFLNNDTQVTGGWLSALYQTFRDWANAGVVGPRILWPNGRLQEAGCTFRYDATSELIGLNESPDAPRYSYQRRVDYVSGACLMIRTELFRKLGGFDARYKPAYCEDADLCLRVQEAGYEVVFCPQATIVHHLSVSTNGDHKGEKMKLIRRNARTFANKWLETINTDLRPKVVAFYLPQYFPFPENEAWWGPGFTEWTNVSKARPNYVGHYQPRVPSDLGYYDLRLPENMGRQAELAQRYGVDAFCYYYYWFGGKRLLDVPVEQMLKSGKPSIPFCLCWANENWTRAWDGREKNILMSQQHSPSDDLAVIDDLIRFMEDSRYIRILGRPLLLIYRVSLFPDFKATAARWRAACRQRGIDDLYLVMVESMELSVASKDPREYGCDAAVEFPPHNAGAPTINTGRLLNSRFTGIVNDYREFAQGYAAREFPGYVRFRSVTAGWDNTARRQDESFVFEHTTPGGFQAWLEEALEQTRGQYVGAESFVFINAWNEWAEGAYLEPDRRFGHAYLQAVKNATESELHKADSTQILFDGGSGRG